MSRIKGGRAIGQPSNLFGLRIERVQLAKLAGLSLHPTVERTAAQYQHPPLRRVVEDRLAKGGPGRWTLFSFAPLAFGKIENPKLPAGAGINDRLDFRTIRHRVIERVRRTLLRDNPGPPVRLQVEAPRAVAQVMADQLAVFSQRRLIRSVAEEDGSQFRDVLKGMVDVPGTGSRLVVVFGQG